MNRACVFKNRENAGMVRKISFQAKSYLFSLHEMFKNSGSDRDGVCVEEGGGGNRDLSA